MTISYTTLIDPNTGATNVEVVNVNPIPVTGTIISIPIFSNQFISNQVTGVAASATVSIINYTVATTTLQILASTATGNADGIYQVLINNVFVMEKRSAWTQRSIDFDLAAYELVLGDNIKINVENNNLSSQNYSANIMGYST